MPPKPPSDPQDLLDPELSGDTDASDTARATPRGKAQGCAKTPGADKPHFHGHRQRLKNRFLVQGGAALPDYELLELVLFQALPRRDVKPLAKDLLDRFGSFADLVTAEPALIRQVPGAGEAVVIALKTVAAAAERLARDEVAAAPVLGNWDKLIKYCRTAMAREGKEHFRVLFLNRKNVLIADEVQWRGTIDHTPLYPREVVKRALELQAAAIIMVHKHNCSIFGHIFQLVNRHFFDCVVSVYFSQSERHLKLN